MTTPADLVESILKEFIAPHPLERRPAVAGRLMAQPSLDKIFDSYSGRHVAEAQKRWQLLRGTLSEEDLKALNDSRQAILDSLYAKFVDDIVEIRVRKERQNLLLAQPEEIQKLRRKASVGSGRRALNLFYLAAIVIIVALVGLCIRLGLAQTAEITVDFNVGEIIGGVLVGAGAAAAGGAYALRAVNERNGE